VVVQVTDLPTAREERVQQIVRPLTLPEPRFTTERPRGRVAQVLTDRALALADGALAVLTLT
jgi:hypothetical protein